MFKSFFPKPGPFFLSAFIWALLAVVFWQAGGGAWFERLLGITNDVPISAYSAALAKRVRATMSTRSWIRWCALPP